MKQPTNNVVRKICVTRWMNGSANLVY